MLKTHFTWLIFAWFGAAHASGFDAPDVNLENELHRQYLQSLAPASPRVAVNAPMSQAESYQLQYGETLGSLSQMLYGDGNYWPKVWAQNHDVTNPQLVRQGHTLQFLMGSEDETPAFRFSEAEDSGVELAAAVSSGVQIQIPPPEVAPKPVLKVPDSFPAWQSVYGKKGTFSIDDSHIKIARSPPTHRVAITAFVEDQAIDPMGNYLEAENESGLPTDMQTVYVKVRKGMGRVGQKYLMVSDRGPVHKMNSQVEGKITSHFIEVAAEVELTEQVESNFAKKAESAKFDIFRAIVLHAFGLALQDYALIPGSIEYVDLTTVGGESRVVAQIIGSASHEASALYGTGQIVFLNRGAKDGLEVGQSLNIFIDRTIRDPETPVTYSSISSGLIKIAKVSGSCATGVIVHTIDGIQQGDRAENKEYKERDDKEMDPSNP